MYTLRVENSYDSLTKRFKARRKKDYVMTLESSYTLREKIIRFESDLECFLVERKADKIILRDFIDAVVSVRNGTTNILFYREVL